MSVIFSRFLMSFFQSKNPAGHPLRMLEKPLKAGIDPTAVWKIGVNTKKHQKTWVNTEMVLKIGDPKIVQVIGS